MMKRTVIFHREHTHAGVKYFPGQSAELSVEDAVTLGELEIATRKEEAKESLKVSRILSPKTDKTE